MLRRPELQVVSLSFLDLLCCAFGAVILLVLLLIPGAGDTETVNRDWTLAVEKTKRTTAHYEDLRVTVYEKRTTVDKKSSALPLSFIQQPRKDVRAQVVPIFPTLGGDTRLEGVRCRVFSRGESTESLENVYVYVTDGVRELYDGPIGGLSGDIE